MFWLRKGLYVFGDVFKKQYPEAIRKRLPLLLRLLRKTDGDEVIVRALSLYEDIVTVAISQEAVLVLKTPDGGETIVDLREAVLVRDAREAERQELERARATEEVGRLGSGTE